MQGFYEIPELKLKVEIWLFDLKPTVMATRGNNSNIILWY